MEAEGLTDDDDDDDPITEDTIRAWCEPGAMLQTSSILAIEHTRRIVRILLDGHTMDLPLLQLLETNLNEALGEIRAAIAKAT